MSTVKKKPGFTIVRDFERADADSIALFSGLASANVSDVQGRQNTLDYRIKPIYHPMPQLLGTALTVKARPGDNMVAFKAIEMAQPGDVIVVAGSFESTLSVWGGIMSGMAKKKGIAGLVTDSLVRDVNQIREFDFPTFATGLTPTGPTKEGSGEINTPVSCGGVVVMPGDIILGDEDGVVVIRKEEARDVHQRVLDRIELENSWLERIERGELFLMDSDEDLQARGATFLD